MSRTRQDRINDYSTFFNAAVARFTQLKQSTPRAQFLDPPYSLHVVPGSRAGAQNHRSVDVFFGQRQIDSYQIGGTRVFVTEYGASLIFERDDNGYVVVLLYPAHSDNRKPRESCLILHSHLDPKELVCQSYAKSTWKDLMAYMEVTCLEGEPSVWQRWRVFWLRLTRSMVVDSKTVTSSLYKGLKEILKYALTIGLSGFLIYLFAPDASRGTIEELHTISSKMDSLANRSSSTEQLQPELQRIANYMDSIQSYNAKINEALQRIEQRGQSKTEGVKKD